MSEIRKGKKLEPSTPEKLELKIAENNRDLGHSVMGCFGMGCLIPWVILTIIVIISLFFY